MNREQTIGIIYAMINGEIDPEIMTNDIHYSFAKLSKSIADYIEAEIAKARIETAERIRRSSKYNPEDHPLDVIHHIDYIEIINTIGIELDKIISENTPKEVK